MATVGRPRVLDEYKRREICALVSVGCGIEGAARYVGCNAVTIRREALRNPDFHEQLRNSELTCELEPLKAMKRAAATHWRAAAWLLERTYPNRFARRHPDAITPQQFDAIIVQIAEEVADELPDAEIAERVCRRIMAMANNIDREIRAAEHVRRDPHSRGRQPAQAPALEPRPTLPATDPPAHAEGVSAPPPT